METPPLTPIRHHVSNTTTSPRQQRRSIGRRSSSFSSNMSPQSRRSSFSNHRLSTASRYSNGIDDFASPHHQHRSSEATGMGNLADELDFADEDWEEGEDGGGMEDEEEEEEERLHTHEDSMLDQSEYGDSMPHDQHLLDPPQTDGARDSGVDVSYQSSPSSAVTNKISHSTRKVSCVQPLKPSARKPSSKYDQERAEDRFTLELEDAMNEIARLAETANHTQIDTTSRTVSVLQELHAQATIESQTYRLSTLMNSVSSQLLEQTKIVQSLSSSVFSPFNVSSLVESVDFDELSGLVAQLLENLPMPEVKALQGLGKLQKETLDLGHILSGILDSLQMGKQAALSASRHLRVTHTMTSELRREREQTDEAIFCIEKEEWDQRLQSRWCAAQCKDVISGFEQTCDGLRKGLEEATSA